MDGPEFRDRGPRHSRGATALRVARNLAAAAVIAGGAFLTAGLVYGDPRFTGLFEVSRGTGHNAGDNAGRALPVAPRSGQVSGQPAVPAGGDRTDTPPPGLEEQDQPLGTPRTPVAASTSYRFLAMNDDGTPVGYSPCRPLHYVVNAALAPEGAERLVEDAIRTISREIGRAHV